MSLLIRLTPKFHKQIPQSCHTLYFEIFIENYTPYIKEWREYKFSKCYKIMKEITGCMLAHKFFCEFFRNMCEKIKKCLVGAQKIILFTQNFMHGLIISRHTP
jgi:hypothetical protein